MLSCGVSKPDISEKRAAEGDKDRIAFLNCSITHDSARDAYEVTLINKIITVGKVKEGGINPRADEREGFIYRELDAGNKALSVRYMANPLEKTIEYVDDDGHLAKRDIRLDSTQFSLRIPLMRNAAFISIERHDTQLLLIDLRK